MKATSDSSLKAFRLHGSWIAILLLCQCQMPSREQWQYIRSNGLLTYLNNGGGHASPPFGARPHSQRYAASPRSTYVSPVYAGRSSAHWSSYARPTPSARPPYLAASTSPLVEERAGPARPVRRSSPGRVKPRTEPRAVTRIPVDEPPAARNEPPVYAPGMTPRSNGTLAVKPTPAAAPDLPYGSSVAGRPNMVNSPYAGKTQLVDVSGMAAGQTVKCPYSGKLFKVPASQQAANKAEPKLEAKLEPKPEPKQEAPKETPEPKDEEKKP